MNVFQLHSKGSAFVVKWEVLGADLATDLNKVLELPILSAERPDIIVTVTISS